MALANPSHYSSRDKLRALIRLRSFLESFKCTGGKRITSEHLIEFYVIVKSGLWGAV